MDGAVGEGFGGEQWGGHWQGVIGVNVQIEIVVANQSQRIHMDELG